ncbi:MAG: dienelactone hydrolase family protein [Phenylobacterium sp.]|uniref:dienelactone hydrolase family protein n=1 Tax=Phenylobacterium sp. TaxID=1871053 RepID=UPI00122BB515|nr:dienelactone hydrolase family protein [Phenylobacterium sp.]TAL30858.1 MAG: dienelactone hydrolase family protein [Phenylobacterium sp.]
MCDDIHEGLIHDPTVSRRTFGILSAAAAGGLATNAYAADVVEKDVVVKTPDGEADAALYYPAGKGAWPGVLIWCDFLSLRPVFREMGRRLAAEGYVVLVPNFYYRSKKAPVFEGTFNFASQDDRAKIAPFRAALTNEAATRDAGAYIDFLDAQPQTNRKKKIGVQGYCMGGPLTVRTAGARPGRVGAAATFHSGGLVGPQPDSPHLLIPKTKAAYLIATAENDDKQRPTEKDELKKLFADNKLKATVEVYAADHGWCVKGGPVYKETEAERAWGELLKLYKTSL